MSEPTPSVLPGAIVSLLSVVVGWCLAQLTPLISHPLLILWRGPKLQWCTVGVETPTNIQGTIQFYANVRVSNIKPRTATQCRGYLLKVEEMSGDRTIRTVFNGIAQCIWEFDNHRDTFDIACGASPAFNIVMYEKGSEQFQLRVRKTTGETLDMTMYEHLFQKHGKHKFSGIVTANEQDALPFAFSVDWTGEWPPIIRPFDAS